jgi:hypothetical protein
LVSDIKECVSEQGAEENVWTEEGLSDRKVAKTAL